MRRTLQLFGFGREGDGLIYLLVGFWLWASCLFSNFIVLFELEFEILVELF